MTKLWCGRLRLVLWFFSSSSPVSCFSLGILHAMGKKKRKKGEIKYHLAFDQEVQMFKSALVSCFPGTSFIG